MTRRRTSAAHVVDKADRWILAATVLASGMAFFNGSATNIALPKIQASFHASLGEVQWIVNAFALVLAALLLFAGSLGDLLGRKKVFLCGIGLFVAGSAFSALSRSIGQLIAFQALQGLGAAMMIPGSLAIINHAFPPSSKGQAIGMWAGYSGGIAASGPFFGGWLVQSFGWPAVWWVNLPLGAIAFLVALRFVPESRNLAAWRLDWWGTLLITLGLSALVFGLSSAGSRGWLDLLTLGPLAAGAIALALFGIVEAKTAEPLFPLAILRSRSVLGANIATLLIYFALNGMFFFLTLNLQQVQGYSPLTAGLCMLPPILLITFLSGPAGKLADRIGPRTPMVVAPLMVAAGMALLILPGTHAVYAAQILPGLLLFGGGMCLVIAPLTKAALAVDDRYSGAASGANNAISRIAALFAIAMLGVVVLGTFRGHLEHQLASSDLSPTQRRQVMAQSSKVAGLQIPDGLSPGLRQEVQADVQRSFVYSFRWVMGINAVLVLLAALTSSVLITDGKRV